MSDMDDVEAFARANRRKRGIRFAILGLVIASPFLWLTYNCQQKRAEQARWRAEARERDALSKGEQAELDKLLSTMPSSIQAASRAFAEDVTPAKLAAAVPGEAGCRRVVSDYGYVLVAPGVQPKPPVFESTASALEDLRARIQEAEDGPTKWDLERARSLVDDLDETVIVVGERVAPVVIGDSFGPGQVRGTAYVYSSRRRKILCAGDFEAQNAAEIAYQYTTSRYDPIGAGNRAASAQAKLEQDLAAKAAAAITASLRQVRERAP